MHRADPTLAVQFEPRHWSAVEAVEWDHRLALRQTQVDVVGQEVVVARRIERSVLEMVIHRELVAAEDAVVDGATTMMNMLEETVRVDQEVNNRTSGQE